MAEFWKSIEGAVVAALIGLIPVITAAVAAWFRAKTRKWQMAQDSTLEAAELGARFNSGVPEQVLEEWAVAGMNRRAQESTAALKDGEALQLVRKVRDRLKQSSGNNGSPVPPPPGDLPKSDPPTG